MSLGKKINDNQDHLNILIKINKKSEITQREMAKELNLSLGKLNFFILELKKKGLIKIKNFNKSKNKLKYAYVLTPQGLTAKFKLTIKFMKRKMEEYDQLKQEIDELNKK